MKSIKTCFDPIYVNNLLTRFPKKYYIRNNNTIINNIPSKNVNYYVVKPHARKCYLWFTYINKQYIALIKFINDNDLYLIDLKFDNTLSYNNVLLYGYFFIKDNVRYFLIDSILNYNNYNDIINHYRHSLDITLKICNKFFSHINNNCDKNSDYLNIFLPYITNNYSTLFDSIYNLGYNPYGISIWNSHKNLGIYKLKNNYNNYEAIFKIKADLNHDTYNLYYNNNNKLEYYNRCIITNYKLSIYMNSLFRNIVENKNLDLLEESEDEEYFENIAEDKYIDIEKCLYFKCHYNKRFKKWVPVTIINDCNFNDIVTKKEVLNNEKK